MTRPYSRALVSLCLMGAAALGPTAASADDACAGVAPGTYTLMSHGTTFIASLETYTSKVTVGDNVVDVGSNWGPDWRFILDTSLHSFAEGSPSVVTLESAHPTAVQWDMDHYFERMATVKEHLIVEKTEPAARKALDCAMARLARESEYVRLYGLKVEELAALKSVKAEVAAQQAAARPAASGSNQSAAR